MFSINDMLSASVLGANGMAGIGPSGGALYYNPSSLNFGFAQAPSGLIMVPQNMHPLQIQQALALQHQAYALQLAMQGHPQAFAGANGGLVGSLPSFGTVLQAAPAAQAPSAPAPSGSAPAAPPPSAPIPIGSAHTTREHEASQTVLELGGKPEPRPRAATPSPAGSARDGLAKSFKSGLDSEPKLRASGQLSPSKGKAEPQPVKPSSAGLTDEAPGADEAAAADAGSADDRERSAWDGLLCMAAAAEAEEAGDAGGADRGAAKAAGGGAFPWEKFQRLQSARGPAAAAARRAAASNDDEGDGEEGSEEEEGEEMDVEAQRGAPGSQGGSGGARPKFGKRLVWSDDLHDIFVDAVNRLGGAYKAHPKGIVQLMNANLTREEVASHLQKYRLKLSGKPRLKKRR